jgi:glycosyltransferase involved in cell wall biosynthesis
MRILIVVNSLQAGGAERYALRLGSQFAKDGNDVAIATINSDKDFFAFPSNVTRICIDSLLPKKTKFLRKFFDILRLSKLIKLLSLRFKTIKFNPDVVIVFEAKIGIATYIFLLFTSYGIVISERNNPDRIIRLRRNLLFMFFPFLLKRSNALYTVQTPGFQDWVKKHWALHAPVTPQHIPQDWYVGSREVSNSRSIISIGRLTHQKGFDVLLAAWSDLSTLTDGWTLTIYGSGRDEYTAYLNSMKGSNVVLAKPSKDIKQVLDNAYLFVSSSRYEGLPNVVLEAISRGLPVIAAYSTDMINDFSDNGAILGYQPEDKSTLIEHLKNLLLDPILATKLSEESIKAANQFKWEAVNKYWYEAMREAIQLRITRKLRKT